MHLSFSFLNWFVIASLLVGLSIMLFLRLREARYRNAPAAILTILTIAQPAYAIGSVGLRAACFAVAAFTTAAAAAALVRRQDPRRIVLLGGSLAGAQFVHPIWGTAASVILPFALRRSLVGDGAGRLAGWYISLLFIPSLSAITLVYLSAVQHLAVPHWIIGNTISGAHGRAVLCLLSASVAVPPLLALDWERSAPDARAGGTMCAIVVATTALLGAFGQDQLVQCAAAASPLLLLIVGTWPESAERSGRAVLLVGGNFLLSWMLVLVLAEFRHV